MRIVLSGIFFPMAILRYFEAALKRRSDIELFTVGPFTGSWIPWNGGMNLPSKYAVSPDFVLSHNGFDFPVVPVGYIEKQLPWKPDLWIQIDAGWYMRGKPAHGKNVIVGTDPHVLNYDNQRTLADDFYCMQSFYSKPGDKYLPYAYDPVWHKPEKQEQIYDATLIGLQYPNRNKLIQRLKEKGVKVYYTNGPVFDEARSIYAQSLIGLNWSSLNDLTARVFELTAMKKLAVVNRVPDLERFFRPGIDLIVFDSLEEAVEKVLYFCGHKEEARKIANQGYKAVKKHTWDARIEQILNDV